MEEEVPAEQAQMEEAPKLAVRSPVVVPWMKQLKTVVFKNMLLLSRRPLQVALQSVSSIATVLLASLVAQRKDFDVAFGDVPMTDCGTVPGSYLDGLEYDVRDEVPLSFNEGWRNGFAVLLMGKSRRWRASCEWV